MCVSKIHPEFEINELRVGWGTDSGLLYILCNYLIKLSWYLCEAMSLKNGSRVLLISYSVGSMM